MTSPVNRPLLDGALHFAVGIEDTFIPQAAPGARPLDEYELTGHYAAWREDIECAARTGAEAIRYGVPWYRIEVEPGRFDWDWLDRVVDHLLGQGLTPIVDLLHYGVPLWLERATADPSYPQRVAAYASAVAERYADRLRVFTPANEPAVNAEWCGETGAWPPYLTGPRGWVAVAMAVARGIVLTQQAVAAAVADPVFVHVEAAFRYEMAEGADEAAVGSVRERAARDLLIEDLLNGLVTGDHPMVGYLLRHGSDSAALDWHADHLACPDVMGVNFYPHLSTGVVTGNVALRAPLRGQAGIDALEEVLRRFADRYRRPVMLTETSARGPDSVHVAWLEESVGRIVELRAAGLPVVGYTWFPLFDLVDWSYRTGTGPSSDYLEPLGLYRVVPGRDGRWDREPTAAVERFTQLVTRYGPARRMPGDTTSDTGVHA